jgi:hypothetical protein
MIDRAERHLTARAPEALFEALGSEVAEARRRGVAVESRLADALLLIADGREVLLGDAALATHLTQAAVVALLGEQAPSTDWLAFEENKIRRLMPHSAA